MAKAGRKAKAQGRAVAKMLPVKREALPESAIVQAEERNLVAVDPQALISQAIAKGLPIETIERLLAMRRELKAEWARERYFAALARFQAKCPNILKEKAVFEREGSNKVRYVYAPLDVIVSAVKVPLEANGFSYLITTKQSETAVTSICHAHHVDGHSEDSEFTIPMDPKAYMNSSQKIASAMTYGKRYALCNAFGIMTTDQDDDANSTNGKPEVQEPKAKPAVRIHCDYCGGNHSETECPDGKKAEASLNATASKLDAALGEKPAPTMAEERKAQEADARVVAARSEVQRVVTAIADGNKALARPYTKAEFDAVKKNAAAIGSDIEKLRTFAVEWQADLDSRKKGET